MMPGVDGVQVIEAMHRDERLQHVPVIMLSALHDKRRSSSASSWVLMTTCPNPSTSSS